MEKKENNKEKNKQKCGKDRKYGQEGNKNDQNQCKTLRKTGKAEGSERQRIKGSYTKCKEEEEERETKKKEK